MELVQLERQGRLELRAFKDQTVHPALVEKLDLSVLKDRLERLVCQEMWVRRARLVLLDLKDLPASLVYPAPRDL